MEKATIKGGSRKGTKSAMPTALFKLKIKNKRLICEIMDQKLEEWQCSIPN